MDKVYILFNRRANHGKGEDGVEEILRSFPQDAIVLDVTSTDVRQLATELDSNDVMVICGGDGTLNHFANSIRGLDIKFPMYIWRSGTGNDFLNDLELPKGEKKILINEYLKDLPTVDINGIYGSEKVCFINGVGMGVDGFVCTIDGVAKKYDKVYLVPTMNGRFLGGGMKMAPMQNRNDDKLSCLVVHNCGRFTLLLLFLTLFGGTNIKHKKIVEWCYGRDILVELDRPTSLQVDGEVYTNITSYRATKAKQEILEKPLATTAAEI